MAECSVYFATRMIIHRLVQPMDEHHMYLWRGKKDEADGNQGIDGAETSCRAGK